MKRPWQITNESEWLRDCEEIVRAAKGILDGSICITEGARRLRRLGAGVRAEDDEDFLVFTGIDSDTDAFPLGDVRSRWSVSALARADSEREDVEAHWRPHAEEAARNLVSKYETAA